MGERLKETDELPMLTRLSTIELPKAKKKRAAAASDADADDNDPDNSPDADDDDAQRDAEDGDGDDAADQADADAKANGRQADLFHGKQRKRKAKGKRQAEVGQDGKDAVDEDEAGDGVEMEANENTVGMGRAYPMSLSSETPVDQWFGAEILDHSKDAVDLSRADGMPLLLNHDPSQQIGVVNNLQVSKDRKLRGDIVFSKSAAPIEQDVVDGIRRNMSVGYRVNNYDVQYGKGDAPSVYTARSWQPMEASIVSVPADHTVGVNRSAAGDRFPVRVRNLPVQGEKREAKMPEANVQAAPNNGAQAAEIVRLAAQHGLSERTAKWLEDGRTIDQVRAEILEARASKPISSATSAGGDYGAGLNLSDGEAKQYSYSRAIMAAANMAEGQKASGFEVEIAQELTKRMPQAHASRGGLLIPTTLRGTKFEGKRAPSLSSAQMRALEAALTRAGTIDSQTANAIKEVVFTEYGGELIEILRNTAKVVKMGARVLTGLSSPIGFPRQTGDVTATWVAENSGSNVGASNVTTDLVTLAPRSLMSTTAYSRQLLVQSSVDVEAMVRQSIAAKHALAWDLAAIHGTGLNSQPLGIYNQPNVQTIDFSSSAYYGATANHVAFTGAVAMQGKLATANALFGELGYLTTPGIAQDAITTLRFPSAAIAQGGQLWNGNIDAGEMAGYEAESTNQVSALLGANGAPSGGTYHGLIFGNWQELLIGQFGGAMEMIVDPYSLKKQGLIEVASFQMADIAVRHPVAFCVGTNLSA